MTLNDKPRRSIRIALHQDKGAGRNLERLLLEQGIDPTATSITADVVIADLTARAPTEINSVASQLREISLDKPLLFLVLPSQLDLPQVKQLAKNETVIISAANERALLAEIAHRTLDTDRASEAAIRLQAISATGLGALPTHHASPEASALLIAPPGPRALDLSSELSLHTSLNTAMSRQQALSALEHGVADRIFILPPQNRRQSAALIKLLRRHSMMSGTPVVVFEEKPNDRHRDYWTRMGADAVVSTSEPALAAAIATQRRRARDAKVSSESLLKHLSFTDHGESSRLCSPKFFDSALALRCRSDMTFCLGSLRLTPHSGETHPQIFTEPAIYVALGCQPADLVTRAAPDTLLISMAGADLHHAKRTMRMISTLVQDLKFGTQTAPITFSAKTHIVQAGPGMQPRDLIRRALKGLQASKPADVLLA